jgi:hypothetical protein
MPFAAFDTFRDRTSVRGWVREASPVIFARRIVIALLLAAFRIWRRLPPEERKRVLNTLRTHGTRAATSLRQRRG